MAGSRRAAASMLTLTILMYAAASAQQAQRAGAQRRPTIEERTAGLRKYDGFFPFYWDESTGQLLLEIPRLDTEVLYMTGLATGLGSNDIGLDRGQLSGSRIVEFERAGPKVMMVQPNYDYRAESNSAAEVRTVRDAFARSILWGFTALAETDGRVLVDATDFLVRDGTNIAQRLRPGSYRLEPSRSAVYVAGLANFPRNTELEVELTFAQQPGAGGGATGAFFEGVGAVAATGEAASLRVHHSLVELPGPGFE